MTLTDVMPKCISSDDAEAWCDHCAELFKIICLPIEEYHPSWITPETTGNDVLEKLQCTRISPPSP